MYKTCSASEMTYIVSSGALNSTHSLTRIKHVFMFFIHACFGRLCRLYTGGPEIVNYYRLINESY